MHKLGNVLSSYASNLSSTSSATPSSNASAFYSSNSLSPPRPSSFPLSTSPVTYTSALPARSSTLYDPRDSYLMYPEYTVSPDVVGSYDRETGMEHGLPRLADRYAKGHILNKDQSSEQSKKAPRWKGEERERPLAVEGGELGNLLAGLALGPEGSDRAVVAGNDILRVISISSPSSLPPLSPPPHVVPPIFSLSNASYASQSRPSTPPGAPPSRSASASDRSSSHNRSSISSGSTSVAPFIPSPNVSPVTAPTRTGRTAQRASYTPPPSLKKESQQQKNSKDEPLLGRGPGGVEIREITRLQGLRDATGGGGIVECRWGSGSQTGRVFVSSRKGGVFCWDVNSPTKILSTLNVDPTRRPISCIRLAPHGQLTPPCLLTAGHDSILRLYDFRLPASSRATLSYSFLNPLTSPITALAVCPTNPLSCVLGLENGTIGWVDWRKGNRMLGRKFSEHGDGGVACLDWKEAGREGELGEGKSDGGWIASGGLDRKVFIYNNADPHKAKYRTLWTPHPVSKLGWRPGHDTEIAVVPFATVSTMTEDPSGDPSIQIWDIRREFVPKYILEGGDGVVAELAWNTHGTLWAAYKNGGIVQHDIRYHSRPLDQIPRSTVAWDQSNNLTFVADAHEPGEIPFDDPIPDFAGRLALLGKEPKSLWDDRFEPHQVLMEQEIPGFNKSRFEFIADRYRIHGAEPEKLCEQNAQAALEANLAYEYKVWSMLGSLLADTKAIPVQGTHRLSFNEDAAIRAGIKRGQLKPSSRQQSPLLIGVERLKPRSRSHSHSPLSGNPSRELPLPATNFPSGSRLRQSHSRNPSADYREVRLEEESSPRGGPSDHTLPVTMLNMDTEFPSESGGGTGSDIDSSSLSSSSSSSDSEGAMLPPSVMSSVYQSGRRSFNSTYRPVIQTQSHLGSRRPSPSANVNRPNLLKRDSKMPNVVSAVDSDDGESSEDDDMADGPYGPYGFDSIISNPMTITATPTKSPAAPLPSNGSAPPPPIPSSYSSNAHLPINHKTNEPTPPSIKPKMTASKAGSQRADLTPSNSPMLNAVQLDDRRSSLTYGLAHLKGNERNRLGGLDDGVQDPALVFHWFLELHQQRIESVRRWVETFLNMGDSQMAACIIIVTSPVIKLVSVKRSERIVTAYHDRLMSMELYVEAAHIRRFSGVYSLGQLTQANTTTYLSCPNHPSHALPYQDDEGNDVHGHGGGVGWCAKSQEWAVECGFCGLPVKKGMLIVCGECGHGGHSDCMQRYFNTEPPEQPFEETDPIENASRETSPAYQSNLSYVTVRGDSPGRATTSFGSSFSVNPGAGESERGISPLGTGHLNSSGFKTERDRGREREREKDRLGLKLGPGGATVDEVYGQTCASGCGHL
ncbi:WD40 repeat-containing protein [Phaffia rhodozyma]|uniref:WD40 repeat-containing protein n=1 Tax=Phaffia rhodozyma TaxID=264483 RepID=A0A0F7SV46_PHARH|nr:WD40 repeat-containing protein [Phaffia rhodozyma]